MKWHYLLFFISTIAITACTSTANKKKISEAEVYIKKFIEPPLVNVKQQYKLDSNLSAMRLIARNNSYLLLHYYSIKENIAAAAKNLDEAIIYGDSLEHAYSNTNKEFKAAFENIYYNSECQRATCLFAKNKYNKAYDIYYKVMEWHKLNNQHFAANYFLFTVGMSSYQQKLYDKAIEFFKKELVVLNTTPENDSILNAQFKYYYTQQALNNIGLSYTKLNMSDSAYHFYQQALKYIKTAKNHQIKNFTLHEDDYNACYAVIMGNLAKVYVKKSQIDSAIIAYKNSIHYTLYTPVSLPFFKRDTVDASLSLIQLAELYKQLNDTPNFKKTVLELNNITPQNLKGHGLVTNTDYVLGSLRINSWYNAINNNQQNALKYLKAYVNAKDSLESIQKESKEQNIIEALEIKAKEDEVNKLKLTNKINKFYTWGSVFLAVIIAIAALLFYRSVRKEKKTNTLLLSLNNNLKQLQKETNNAYEEAIEANKEKDKILRIVAHDLRNPLSGINAIANILVEDDKIENKKEMLDAIANTSKRTITLVNELLQTQDNTKQTYSFKPVNINNLVIQIVELIKASANQKEISIELIESKKNIIVYADENKIERVIQNLLHNAIKFSCPKNNVVIKLENNNEDALISIIDKGIGMNEETLKNLFKQEINYSQQGTRNEKSYGLGLSICKKIIEDHEGELLVHSILNQGSTFTIKLKCKSV